MSDSDSFIDDVNDELRRDRLFAVIRRWGWVAVLAVVLLVGGAAWVEWQRSSDRSDAQAFGDAIVAALDNDTPEARRAALTAIPATGTRAALLAMLAADTLDSGAARGATTADLRALSDDATLPPLYRDLATLKYAMLAQGDLPPADLRALLEPLTLGGAPYRLLAVEQLALVDVAAGDAAGAIIRLQGLLAEDGVGQDLRNRVRQLIVALGGTLDAA